MRSDSGTLLPVAWGVSAGCFCLSCSALFSQASFSRAIHTANAPLYQRSTHAKRPTANWVISSSPHPPASPATGINALRHGFVPIPSGSKELHIEAELPPASYAVSVYEDLNSNHKLDHNLIGIPREPVGASNNPAARFGPRTSRSARSPWRHRSNHHYQPGTHFMSDSEKNKRVIVIGAGLGGMSAAIMLASRGFKVTILEKNAQVGGKLNQLQTKGFSFDLGPSIFTLPEIFRPIFEGDGKKLEDYINLQRVDPQWRNFFEDGVVVDLWEKHERMRAELDAFGPQVFGEYKAFLAYSRRQYDIVDAGYLRQGLDTFGQFFRFYGWKDARDLDYLRSMSGSIYKRLSNRYLRDIFEYFIKYVGSSALDSPAFMNLMPTIQMEFGLWYVAGGLYQLGHAFRRRLEETGVTLCLEHEVLQIDHSGNTVTGVQVRDSKR